MAHGAGIESRAVRRNRQQAGGAREGRRGGKERREERAIHLHEELLDLAQQQAVLDSQIGPRLLEARRLQVHRLFGFGSFFEYAERFFGFSHRSTSERLRVAESLEHLPKMGAALAEGQLSWSAARELTRVAVADTEGQWIDTSRGRTVREVERMVSGLERGDRPGTLPRQGARRHVVRYEVSALTLGLVREAKRMLTREAGQHLSDDQVLELMSRVVLGGPGEEQGRSPYQIAMIVCDGCQRGWVEADGETFEVEATVVAQARCDAQHIGRVDGHIGRVDGPDAGPSEALADGASNGAAKAPASTPVGENRANPGEKCPLSTPMGAEAAKPAEKRTRSTHRGPNAANPAADGAARSARSAPPKRRASQTIPPSIRRLVQRRDRGRCIMPGCTNSTFVEVHHFDLLSEGGSHDPDRMGLACSVHHAAVHEGRLIIDGRVSTGLRFLHADGTPYGSAAVSPARASMEAQLFGILKGMGFREREAREAVDRVRTGLSDETTMQQAVAQALRAMPVPGRLSAVRESFAEYVRLAPAA